MTGSRRPPVAIVGAGHLARALLPRLVAAGYPVAAIAAERPASARALARSAPGAIPAVSAEAAVESAALVLLAVPDREIAPLARRLAARVPGGWRRRTVLHHAGALGPAVLAPLRRRGAAAGVLHPFQVLGIPRVAAAALPGSRARIEGDPRAVRVARRLALDLGLVPVELPRAIGAAGRSAWHAAASLASNDLVALISLAAGALRAAGLDEREALDVLLPIARGTLAHLEAGGIAGALTGPVVRGDAATLRSQLRTLGRASREAASAHRALSRRLLRIVEDSGMLSPAERSALRRLLGGKTRGRRGGRIV